MFFEGKVRLAEIEAPSSMMIDYVEVRSIKEIGGVPRLSNHAVSRRVRNFLIVVGIGVALLVVAAVEIPFYRARQNARGSFLFRS